MVQPVSPIRVFMHRGCLTLTYSFVLRELVIDLRVGGHELR